MHKAILISAVLLISLSYVMNAPGMFEYYKKWFNTSQCEMPKGVKLLDTKTGETTFYHLPLHSCQDAKNDDSSKYNLFDVCQSIFTLLHSIVCTTSDEKIDRDKNVDVAFSMGSPCAVLHQMESISSLLPSIPDCLRDKKSCLTFCTIHRDLCKSLVWLYQVKKMLGYSSPLLPVEESSFLMKKPTVPDIEAIKSVSTKSQEDTNTKTIPDIDRNESSKADVSNSSDKSAALEIKVTTSKNNFSEENSNILDGSEQTTRKTSIPDASSKNMKSLTKEEYIPRDDIVVEGTVGERGSRISFPVEKPKAASKPMKDLSTDVSFKNPEKAIETSRRIDDLNSLESGDLDEDFEEQRYATSPFHQNTDKDKIIASIIEEKISETQGDNSQPQQSLEDDIGDVGFSKGLQENIYTQPDESHFFVYFLVVVAIIIGCYVLFHNKQKIIALIVEGRHERRRRPNGVSYRKLETKT